MMTFAGLVILGMFGVWRLTHLLNAEDGPFDLVTRLRAWDRGGALTRQLDCFACLSLWVALPFALLAADSIVAFSFLWPALSAGAIVFERAAGSAAEVGHL